MKNTLTILCGLPRSGKSTWIEKNKGDAVVISHDWIREHILGNSYAESANAIVWTLADAALRIILGQGKDAILDGTNLTSDIRKFFVDIAREYGAYVTIVFVQTPLDICLKRNSKNPKLPKEKLISMNESMEYPNSQPPLCECNSIIWVDDCWFKEEL